jgi:hypothetical protein
MPPLSEALSSEIIPHCLAFRQIQSGLDLGIDLSLEFDMAESLASS